MATFEIKNASILCGGLSILGGVGAAGLVSRLARIAKPESRYIITDVGVKVITAVAFIKGVDISYSAFKNISDVYEWFKKRAEERKHINDDGIREEDPDDE